MKVLLPLRYLKFLIDSLILNFNTIFSGEYKVIFDKCQRGCSHIRALKGENETTSLVDLLRASLYAGYPVFLSIKELQDFLSEDFRLLRRKLTGIRAWQFVKFLIALSFLKVENNSWILDRSFILLDRGEKTIISQLLGVLFAIVSAEKKLEVSYYIYTHLLDLNCKGRQADFLGLKLPNQGIILEAKGSTQERNIRKIEEACKKDKPQVENTINCFSDFESEIELKGYISITQLSNSSISTYLIDPPPYKKGCLPNKNIILHYIPIISFLESKLKNNEQIKEIKVVGEIFKIGYISNFLKIGLHKEIYTILKKKEFSFKELEEYIQKFKKIREKINSKTISLGLDGIIFIIDEDKIKKPCYELISR